MIKFCPDKKQADYLKKPKVTHQDEEPENVVQARRATEDVMELINKEKKGEGKVEEEKVEEVELESASDDEDETLQGEVEGVDASANDKSTNGEGLEDLLEKNDQDKLLEDEDMQDSDEIVLAGGAVKTLPEVRSSAFSKYASTEVAIHMAVDSPEAMLGLTKLKDSAQRRRVEYNAQLKGAHGSGGKLGNSGGISSGAGGATGVKNSKISGRLPLKTKESARKGQ